MKESILCKNKDKIEVALSCVILLFLWQIIALIVKNDIYLPTIDQVFRNLNEIVEEERFLSDISMTIGRTIISFFIALIVSIIVSVAGYISSLIRNFFKPLNMLAQSIPMMILVILALIWFDKDNAPYIVGVMITFPILYEAILGSMIDIDKNLIEMANIYNINILDKITRIYLPTIKFRIVSIIASTISLALKIVIAGEVYGQPDYGIGTMIQVEKVNFNTSGIFAWLIIIVLISVLLNNLQKLMLRRTFSWKR
ncbi:MAG: ABC transporter permease [Romboutsia sp.]|uniref:ABC transporter permease n=1 Tax=Romboutsia sp. TaxID=1965302 RepID=UPI003F2D0DD0